MTGLSYVVKYYMFPVYETTVMISLTSTHVNFVCNMSSEYVGAPGAKIWVELFYDHT